MLIRKRVQSEGFKWTEMSFELERDFDLSHSQTDPSFQFYVSVIFEDRDNFVSFDQGLLAFIKVVTADPLPYTDGVPT